MEWYRKVAPVSSFSPRSTFAVILLLATLTLRAAGQSLSNSPPTEVLLLDSLGRTVSVPTNKLPSELQPSAGVGLKYRIPAPTRGQNMPAAILQSLQKDRGAATGFQFLPAVPPQLMPYPASQDEFGNTAIRPGALISFFPLEPIIEDGKYWLSDHGLRYSLQQTVTYVSMTDVMKGDNTLGFYTFDLKAKWAIFDARDAGTAGWISSQVDAKTGLGEAGDTQSARSNLGTLTNPTGIWSSHNGFRVPELAWQQSLCEGEIVVVAGMVNQRNYADQNVYAESGRSQFFNSALIHSMVLPLRSYNFGVNVQWQPVNEYYAMFGASAGNATAGNPPWTDLSLENWSLLWELAYAPNDLFGLGPGIYRIQPFVAEKAGQTGGGLCFDLQQKLGATSPFGWFGRFGFGDADVSNGASAQVGTGLVMQAPFQHVLFQRTSNDRLGAGFVWSQPSATTKTVYHQSEYAFEAVYAMQLTPTLKLEPDWQVIWNPINNPNAGPAMVFQLQLALTW